MINLRSLTLWAALVAGAGIGAVATTAIQNAAQADNESMKTATIRGGGDSTITIDCGCREEEEEHWTEDHLTQLRAEQTLEQSIYLSAVQIVKIERAEGDLRAAKKKLEDLITRVPKQELKNAIRRLLVEISIEEGDAQGTKEAEQYLDEIISESLLQY